MRSEAAIVEPAGWRGELQLTLAHDGRRTVVAHRRHLGPLNVQRAFYPEGAVAHVYLLHPPGGVVGGDTLSVDIAVQTGAHALVTTPASGKLYRSDGREAHVQQTLRVADGAALEWLPQETLVYAGANARMDTRIELDAAARFIGWEMLCLGRPACAERFDTGRVLQRVELWRDSRSLWLERASFEGAAPALNASWGMRSLPLTATLVATVDDAQLLARVRAAMTAHDTAHSVSAATQLDGVLVCRYLGAQAQHARACLGAAWAEIRRTVLARDTCVPRIWNT